MAPVISTPSPQPYMIGRLPSPLVTGRGPEGGSSSGEGIACFSSFLETINADVNDNLNRRSYKQALHGLKDPPRSLARPPQNTVSPSRDQTTFSQKWFKTVSSRRLESVGIAKNEARRRE
ncbi:hypothetical protein EDB87DRAFT_1575363 [Lactarius vividus]|nr:hypothetical protein EDB87DRAFT_1575363 [Lactarius vividus]